MSLMNRSHADDDAKYCLGQYIDVTVMLTFIDGMLFNVMLSMTGAPPSVCVELLTVTSIANHISKRQTTMDAQPNG